MTKAEKIIQTYIQQIKLRRYNNINEFLGHISKRYGKPTSSSLEDSISLRGSGQTSNIYPILYQNLDLSLDVLSYFELELHQSYLKWISEKELKSPLKILDLGCGNGFLTCFYAKLFPNSQVIGIDKYLDATNCASELACKLGLNNIKFLTADLAEPLSLTLSEPFDLITSVAVYNEAIGILPQDDSMPIRELICKHVDSVFLKPLNQIADILTIDTGILISLEKLQNIRAFSWWASALSNAGFKIDFRQSEQISYKSKDQKIEKVPILLANKSSGLTKVDVNDLLAFWLHSKHQSNFNKFRTFDFQEDLAETAFSFINPKILRFGIKAENLEGIVYRAEIWQAGPFLLVYEFDNIGQHGLQILPSIFYNDAESHVKERTKKMFESWNISTYVTF